MKYLKILAFMLVALNMIACKDDKPEINTDNGVTVCMEQAEMKFLETKGIVKVPFEVKGKRNGYVTLTCQVSEFGSEVAMEDVHYFVTDYTVNVDTMDNSGYFEIKLVDDSEPNAARQFQVKIVDVQGATVSGLDATVVTIRDNDSDPYLRIAGKWRVPNVTMQGGPNADQIITIEAYDEGEEGYYSYYHIYDLLDIQGDPCPVKALFDYDKKTLMGTITIEYGQNLPDAVYNNETYSNKLTYLFYSEGDGPYIGGTNGGTAVFAWTENVRELRLVSWAGQDDVEFEGACFAALAYQGTSPRFWWSDINGVTTMYKVIN